MKYITYYKRGQEHIHFWEDGDDLTHKEEWLDLCCQENLTNNNLRSAGIIMTIKSESGDYPICCLASGSLRVQSRPNEDNDLLKKKLQIIREDFNQR